MRTRIANSRDESTPSPREDNRQDARPSPRSPLDLGIACNVNSALRRRSDAHPTPHRRCPHAGHWGNLAAAASTAPSPGLRFVSKLARMFRVMSVAVIGSKASLVLHRIDVSCGANITHQEVSHENQIRPEELRA